MQNHGLLAKISALGLAILLISSCSASGELDGSSGPKPQSQVDLMCLGELEPLPRPQPALPVTVNSSIGESTKISSVDRVVGLAPGAAEIVWSLGLGDVIVGIDLVSSYPGSEKTPIVNPGHEVALETLLSLKPTLVLADKSDENADAVLKLTELGIPVVAIPEATAVSEISPRILAVANALGVKSAGEELVTSTQAKLEKVASTSRSEKKIAFLYLRGNAGVYLIGGKASGADSIIAALGAIDAGTELGIDGFAPLTAESLAKANPDVVMVMNEGLESVGGVEKLLALPGVSSTSAAKNSAVIQADDRVLLSFGPHTPGVISCLAEQLSSFNESA
jgi:iron complex transport system substrate-binding protein